MVRGPLVGAVLTAGLVLAWGQAGRSEELAPEYRSAVSKGLAWLAGSQHRDGHWSAGGGQYPTSMTALAGLALLMEGSTVREGRYADNVRRAVDWLMDRSQRSGLLGPNIAGRGYMHDHGYALLFLACVYGEEEDGERRRKLEALLTRAVDFSCKAQSSRGGWFYTSRLEGGDMDEGSVTVTQVQGLRAARNAGIPVPKAAIEKAEDYLKKCTTARGGVVYSLSQGQFGSERPALTAAAVACMFSAGEYDSPIAKRWLKYCREAIPPLDQGFRMGHDEYTHYYYAQVLYTLGDQGYVKLFPEVRDNERLTWSKYRKATFDYLVRSQSADGSWTGTGNWGHIGPVYSTALALAILQLDNGTLPIYQR